jgi:hypothetical protein
MIIIEINAGEKIQYEVTGTVISFANGELALNCASYQQDWNIHLDICSNTDGTLVIGTENGILYVAQLDIPARQYTYPEPSDDPEDQQPPTPIPLDMDTVTLTLWSIEEWKRR